MERTINNGLRDCLNERKGKTLIDSAAYILIDCQADFFFDAQFNVSERERERERDLYMKIWLTQVAQTVFECKNSNLCEYKTATYYFFCNIAIYN